MLRVAFLFSTIISLYCLVPTASAQNTTDEVRLDTPSGLPVPRFVTLKSGKTYCRTGPSFDHPVRITFKRIGLPLKVIAETADHWRKLQDLDGDECWVHRAKLSSPKTALVIADVVAIRSKPFSNAPEKARLGAGVIVKIDQRRNKWIKVTTQGNHKGWAHISEFWGIAP